MRVGLISDIHGNLLALDAVLAELEQEELDGMICLGDVAVGPQPRETLARVRDLGCPIVMGNWDAWFCNPRPPAEGDDEVAVKLAEIATFWADELTDEDRTFLHNFTYPKLELPLGELDRALCFHGSPTDYDAWIYATTPDDELGELLGDERAIVMIGGHTHVQMLRSFDRCLLVNPGSVGLPFSDWWPKRVRIAPWAEYAVLSYDEGRLAVDFHRTPFDVEALLEISLESGMPHARWWNASWRTESTVS